MAIPFSQTLESRHPDISRLLMFGMLLAVPLALAWGWWFLTAPIPVYESSTQVHISDNTLTGNSFAGSGGAMRVRSLRSREITAVFSQKSLEKIAGKQQGYFFPEQTKGKQAAAIPVIPVTVVGIPRGFARKAGEVTLRAEYPADQPDPFLNLKQRTIRIAVNQITPAQMLARSSGLHSDTGPVSFARRKTEP
jgi:hypothetical protein